MISVLATVDGSPISRAVIPALENLAREGNMRVQLLSVVERPPATGRRSSIVRSPTSPAIGVPGGPGNFGGRQTPEAALAETDDQAIDRALAEARDFLDQAASPLRSQGLLVETEVAMADDAGEAIIDVARRGQYDLIAMATHGRGGLSGLVQGSTASQVVRSGVAPVLLVRPSED